MSDVDELSNSSHDTCQTTDSMWDMAINDARTELADAERRVSRLRNALRIFQENKVKGLTWPGKSGE